MITFLGKIASFNYIVAHGYHTGYLAATQWLPGGYLVGYCTGYHRPVQTPGERRKAPCACDGMAKKTTPQKCSWTLKGAFRKQQNILKVAPK